MTSRPTSAVQRRFEFHPSHILTAVLTVAHITVLVALLPLALPLWTKLALAVVIVTSLAYHVWLDAQRAAPTSGTALVLEGDKVMLVMRDGQELAVSVSKDSLVTPWLTILNLMPLGAHTTRRILILPDSMDAESFRQLRVWLKWASD